MSTHVAQPGVPEPIRSKLGALRRAVRLWFWIDGLAALCVHPAGYQEPYRLAFLNPRGISGSGTESVEEIIQELALIYLTFCDRMEIRHLLRDRGKRRREQHHCRDRHDEPPKDRCCYSSG